MTFYPSSTRDERNALSVEPVWLPGNLEITLAGEKHNAEPIAAAAAATPRDAPAVAVLIPEPANPYDSNSVAVFVGGHLVGRIPKWMAGRIHHRLRRFMTDHRGRPMACPATFGRGHHGDMFVSVYIDSVTFDQSGEAVTPLPELAVSLTPLIRRLDELPPPLNAVDRDGRGLLQLAEIKAESTEDDYERPPHARADLAAEFRRTVDRLYRAGDPTVQRAWLGLAGQLQYVPGRRDECLAAFIEAVHLNREDAAAWEQLLAYVTRSPHLDTMIQLLARAPFTVRAPLVHILLSVSDGADRYGRMKAPAGEQLRQAMLDLAEDQSDHVTTAILTADFGRRLEKTDPDQAVAWWRASVAAGGTDPHVADRLSIWLVRNGERDEAATAIRSALASGSMSPTLRERLEKRLARCE